MALTNWITETSIDPSTGGVLVTLTVSGPASEKYQVAWVSDAPGIATVGSAPGVQLNHPAVSNEAAIAGPSLLAAVSAKIVSPGLTRIAKPHK